MDLPGKPPIPGSSPPAVRAATPKSGLAVRPPRRKSASAATAVGEPPIIIGGCEVLNEIARGGMGVVYRARHVKLDRVVALKVMIAGEAASEGQVKRFLQEARSAARLKHPNIVPIFEVGEVDGQHFFTMEFIEGESLSALIARGPLNAVQAVALMAPVAEAVHYAHSQGIIHRDLKPANILIDERAQPRVADFGLARDISGASSLSQTGHLVGTPAYLSPEQAQGLELDPRSDVYALGVVMYEMLTGKVPFEGPNLPVLLTRIAMDDPPPLEQQLPNIDPDLKTIVITCLEKDRQRRYRTAEALAADLRRFGAGEPISARPASLGYRLRKQVKKHRSVVTGVAIALVAGLVLAGVWSHMEQQRAAADASRQQAEADRVKAEAQARSLAATNRQLMQQSQKRWETVFEDSFDGTATGPLWQAKAGRWQVANGFAHGNGTQDSRRPEAILYLTQPVAGDLSIILQGQASDAGNSELALCVLTTQEHTGSDGYFISLKPTGLRLARENVTLFAAEDLRLVPNQPVRIEFTREGEHLRLAIDDHKPIELTDWTPPTQADRCSVALYCWNSVLQIDAITVRQAALPEKAGVLDMAEYQRARGKSAAALDTIELFLQQNKDLKAEERALQLKAVCLESLEKREESEATWRELAQKFHTDDNVFRAAAARIRGGAAPQTVIEALELEYVRANAWQEMLPTLMAKLYTPAGKGALSGEETEQVFALAERCLGHIPEGGVQASAKLVIAQSAESLSMSNPPGFSPAARIGLMQRVVRFRPDNELSWTHLSELHEQAGQVEAAVEDLQQAVLLNPKSAPSHYELARAYGLNKQTDKAIAEVQAALALNPNLAMAWDLWGTNLRNQGNFEAAVEKYRRAVTCDPRFNQGWLNMATAQFKLGKREEAVASMEQAVKATPDNRRLLDALAQLYLLQADEPHALACYENLGRLDPQNTVTKLTIANLLVRAGRYTEALAIFDACEAADRTDPTVQFQYGLAQWAVGRYADAETTLNDLCATHPADALPLGLHAACLARLKRVAEAHEQLAMAERNAT
ncbi:MAG TPA: protein kinase, partial [Planctomycetota bacterium]|nr:protein kinase [Planctomycetota bacterium]